MKTTRSTHNTIYMSVTNDFYVTKLIFNICLWQVILWLLLKEVLPLLKKKLSLYTMFPHNSWHSRAVFVDTRGYAIHNQTNNFTPLRDSVNNHFSRDGLPNLC